MKTLVVLSGGMDSTVLLHHHLNIGDEVRAISINYGQRHVKELDCAEKTAHRLGISHLILPLQALAAALPGSSQTDGSVAVPEGHYEQESMKLTVVPNRNMILLAIAAGHGIAHKYNQLSYAAHAGDHAIYPDCRPEFYQALGATLALADWNPINLCAPFGKMTKADIVQLGVSLKVNFADTWSCYVGGQHHCGRCGTCVERREAFHLAGIDDPTLYLPLAPTLKELIAKNFKI